MIGKNNINHHRSPIQGVIEMREENLNGDRTHQNKLLFYLPFFRKLKFIFTVFRVIESFMDGTVKEQRLRTKKVNAQKVYIYGKNPGE
jgi:hypothetical protein